MPQQLRWKNTKKQEQPKKHADKELNVGVLFADDGSQKDQNDAPKDQENQESTHTIEAKKIIEELANVIVEVQCRYGNPATRRNYRSHNGHTNQGGYTAHLRNHVTQGKYNENDREDTHVHLRIDQQTSFDQLFFNCGSVDCPLNKCPEPKDQDRKESTGLAKSTRHPQIHQRSQLS